MKKHQWGASHEFYKHVVIEKQQFVTSESSCKSNSWGQRMVRFLQIIVSFIHVLVSLVAVNIWIGRARQTCHCMSHVVVRTWVVAGRRLMNSALIKGWAVVSDCWPRSRGRVQLRSFDLEAMYIQVITYNDTQLNGITAEVYGTVDLKENWSTELICTNTEQDNSIIFLKNNLFKFIHWIVNISIKKFIFSC